MRSDSTRKTAQPRTESLTWRSRRRLRPDPHLRTAPNAVLPDSHGSSSPPRLSELRVQHHSRAYRVWGEMGIESPGRPDGERVSTHHLPVPMSNRPITRSGAASSDRVHT